MPAEVARQLLGGISRLPGEPGDAEAFIRMLQHVLLGHLDDAAALHKALDRLQSITGDDAVLRGAIARGRLALALVDDLGTPSTLEPAERVRALYDAALAHTRRRQWVAVNDRLAAAGALAERDAAAQRAYAAMANNIAAHLRDGLATGEPADNPRVRAMLDAATRVRQAWTRAGGWLEAERAEYQLARCHAAAGQGQEAVAHAQDCLALCVANAADAFECFFAYEALAHAQACAGQPGLARQARDAMADGLQQMDDASRAFAAPCLAQVDALLDIAACPR